MKKIHVFMMAAAMTLGLASCSNEDNAGTPTVEEETQDPQLIIKEINVGGVKDANNKNYLWSKGVIIYNNSNSPAVVKNLAIGTIPPANAHATNNNYGEDGKLVYEDAGWVPMIYAIWYLPEQITIQPFSDAVVAINGAIDHTATVPNAINFANSEYYCMYDPESGFNNANAYPAPYEGIPTTHYWKAAKFGLGNAWAISILCPNLVLFQFPEDVDPATYCASADNQWYDGGKETAANLCVKIPTDWVLDGVELYQSTKVSMSVKRVPSSIDAGYGLYNNYQGYSAYRNIDEEATVKYSDNINKLVYNYDQGVLDTTDPSGIDAVASIKNGAKIYYQDTNNSTDDFHVRATWSLK